MTDNTHPESGLDLGAYTVTTPPAPAAPTQQVVPGNTLPIAGQMPAPVVPFVPPQAAPAIPAIDDQRLKRIEEGFARQQKESAELRARQEASEFATRYALPEDMDTRFDAETIDAMNLIAKHVMASDEGREIVSRYVRQLVPEIVETLAFPSQETQSTTPPQEVEQQAALDAQFMSNLGMNVAQIRMLPGYGAHMESRQPDGARTTDHVQHFLQSGNLAQVFALLRPLVDSYRATQAPGPVPQFSGVPGSVAAPQNWQGGTQQQAAPTDPNEMVLSRQKLQPILDKARAQGASSLTSEELKIMDAADAALLDNRVGD